MNQCVPSWDNLDQDNSSLPRFNFEGHPSSNSANSLPLSVPSLDYEVAELTWENGQVTMHGLGPPRLFNKPAQESLPKYDGAWDRSTPAGGTLESLVDQATRLQPPHGHKLGDDRAPWFDYYRARASVGGVAMDALVPCDNYNNKGNNNDGGGNENCEESTHVLGSGAVPGVGSCSGTGAVAGHFVGAAIGGSCCRTNGSACESATCGPGKYSCQAATTTFDTELGGGEAGGFTTSPSMASAENTISAAAGKEYTKTSGDDHGSVCRRRSQRESTGNDDRRKKGSGKSSISTKRSRAAAIHNQSERKRRDRINERMRTLQKLVPNSSKADKASMLDEAIEYLKQMQSQVQLMSRMVPLALQQQQIQMSMMGMGMGMGMGTPLIPPLVPLQPPWDNLGDHLPSMPDPLFAFLPSQSQPMNMEAYNRLAALFQQFQNSGGSNACSSFKN